MECRAMEMRLLSATDIKNVNRFTKMDVFALILVAGDPRSRQRTPTSRRCGTSPKWNYSLRFTLDETALSGDRLTLMFQLRSERLLGDKDIGHLHIPLLRLLRSGDDVINDHRLVSAGLTAPNGKQKGILNFSYSFGTKFAMPIKIPPQLRPPTTARVGGAPPAYRFPTYRSRFAGPAGGYGGRCGYAPPCAEAGGGRGRNGRNLEVGIGAGVLGKGGLLVAADVTDNAFDDHGVDSLEVDMDMGMDF